MTACDPPRTLAAFGCEPREADVFRELSARFGFEASTTPDPVSTTNVELAAASRCVSVGHKATITGRELRALRDVGVEYLSTRSVGLDHIDLATAQALGLTVEGVAYSPDGVADFTVMLLLMALRGAPGVVAAAQRQDFRLPPARGRDLRDLTVGVVGAGPIGAAVIRRLAGFGCHVLASTGRRPAPSPADPVPLDVLVRDSDVVTLHVPLHAGTRHLIGADRLAVMRPNAVLVNTARGGLVDTAALVDALERGRLGGAALDVIEGEEGFFYLDRSAGRVDHPFLPRLLALPNVVVMPHTAYFTERALRETVERTLEHCETFERRRTSGPTEDRDPVRGLL